MAKHVLRNGTLALCVGALLIACGDGASESDPDPDARLAKLEVSRKAWQQLVAEHGDTYWYEEQNCPLNTPEGEGTLVQIDDNAVQHAVRHQITPEDCEPGAVFRFESFTAASLDVLYERCHDLLMRASTPDGMLTDIVFETDADGVITTCAATALFCNDACDEGFHVAQRTFGNNPRAAEATCQVDGSTYASGSNDVPDPDSCNTCQCIDGKLDSCTEINCPNE